MSTNCNHEVWVKDGKVYMANDDDGWYVQEFSSPSQIDAFIKVLESARDECFRSTSRAVDEGDSVPLPAESTPEHLPIE